MLSRLFVLHKGEKCLCGRTGTSSKARKRGCSSLYRVCQVPVQSFGRYGIVALRKAPGSIGVNGAVASRASGSGWLAELNCWNNYRKPQGFPTWLSVKRVQRLRVEAA